MKVNIVYSLIDALKQLRKDHGDKKVSTPFKQKHVKEDTKEWDCEMEPETLKSSSKSKGKSVLVDKKELQKIYEHLSELKKTLKKE